MATRLLTHLLTMSATIVRRTEMVDNDGEVTYSEIRLPSIPCYIEPRMALTNESRVGGMIVESEWLLFTDRDVALSAIDSIEVNGMAFEMVGPSWPVWNPRERMVHHHESTLRLLA